ncbi:hypothetical protein [Thiomonas sp. FB-6]|uniref:hypothetical protein n=1 Tax=Thiomonas sp. FB-6 TaxID=1158291 RepID=UPI0003A06C2E|nr:hypothetical protein [Thiomonas sp. FB-6]
MRVDPDEQRKRRAELSAERRARKRKERIAIVRAHLPALGIDPTSESGQRVLQRLEYLEGERN